MRIWSTTTADTTAYNAAGDRLAAEVSQPGHANTRSWIYAYDELSRLTSAERGTLLPDHSGLDHTAPTQAERTSWGLDTLGNWTEPAGYNNLFTGRVQELYDTSSNDYALFAEEHAHSTDQRNRLTEIEVTEGNTPVVIESNVHDPAGNLIADADYWYQYDAFNRLASVHSRGTLIFHADGTIADGTPGSWQMHMAYDAIGRLVRIQKPWGPSGTDHREALLYYDGVRRIAEVFKDPVVGPAVPIGSAQGSGYITYTDREYVWGPDYIDECLWQITRPGDVLHVLHDASKDVVALLDDTGAVARQYTYDPYGQVIADESFNSPAHNRLGHHGLFFDRLNTNPPALELTANARGLYHNRNRTYDPRSGEFTSVDPNGTGSIQLTQTTAVTGTDSLSRGAMFDAMSMYGDGMNLYAALGSAPLVNSDPMGLWMWGDWMDTLGKGAEVAGLAAAAAETYQFVMEAGVEWALDWDRADDEYTDLFAIARAVSSGTDAEVDSAAQVYATLIQGSIFKSPKAIASFAKATKGVQKLFTQWLGRGKKNVRVYIGKRNGRPYVGITNNIDRRGGEHGFKLQELGGPFTRNQARAIENRIISHNPGFDNQIQSISSGHRFAKWADLWAEETMKALKMSLHPKP